MKKKSAPVCSYYLVKEGTPNESLNYSGSSLKRCTRCKGAYYTDINAQKLHWKTHKKLCKPKSIDTSSMNLDQCQEIIQKAVCGGSPDIYFVIKRVRELMDNKDEDSDTAAFHLHSLARGIQQLPNSHLLGLVASPFMSTLLFGDEEDLLSDKYRLLKYTRLRNYNGRPSEEYVEDIEDEDEKAEVTKLLDQYDELDDSWSQPASCSFCYLYFNLIVSCAIFGRPGCSSTHDGNGSFRGGNPKKKSAETIMSTAALRRAMELWTDPMVLASCGDAMAPAASLAATAIEYYTSNSILCDETFCNDHELVPGLAIDRLAMTCMREILDGAGSASYSAKLLKKLQLICQEVGTHSPWYDLPIDRRARFALAFHEYAQEADDRGSSPFGGRFDKPCNGDMNTIFRTIVGLQNPFDLSTVKSVWKAAADNGEFLGPNGAGSNYHARTFFYSLHRSESYSEDMDVIEMIKEFYKIPNISRAPDDPKCKEKDECLRLALGDRRHEEWNRIFSK